MLSHHELQQFLDEKFRQYNTPEFIDSDPIQIPHRFENKADIEIAAFLTASIAWGNRKMIIRSADRMMQALHNAPHNFLQNADEADFAEAFRVVHRTFQGTDFYVFLKSLQNIYKNHGGLDAVFAEGFRKNDTIFSALIHFRQVFFEIEHPLRTQKHIPDVSRGSAAKRLNMFLMWMTRHDLSGVHFGLWTKIPTSALIIPLDVHVGRTARSLGLLTRLQDDWRAAEELTSELQKFDRNDPVKYDFALFGTGVFEGFGK